jgi:hypothetical protein
MLVFKKDNIDICKLLSTMLIRNGCATYRGNKAFWRMAIVKVRCTYPCKLKFSKSALEISSHHRVDLEVPKIRGTCNARLPGRRRQEATRGLSNSKTKSCKGKVLSSGLHLA